MMDVVKTLRNKIKGLKSEIRMWKKQGSNDVVRICKKELRQHELALAVIITSLKVARAIQKGGEGE